MLKIQSAAYYDDRKIIFDNINVDFLENKIYGLISENDVDTSLLLKCINGIFQVNEGSITYQNKTVFDNLNYIRSVFLLDDNYYFNGFNLKMLIKYIANNFECIIDQSTYNDLLKRLDYNENKPFFTMSKGQQKLAYFIIMFSLDFKVILLDEFFDGIDMIYKKYLKTLVKDYVSKNDVILIMASNSVKDIYDICDEVIIFSKGTIKAQYNIDTLNHLYKKYQVVTSDKLTIDDFKLKGIDVKGYSSFKNIHQLTIPNNQEQVDLIHHIDSLDIKELKPSEEEVILYELRH